MSLLRLSAWVLASLPYGARLEDRTDRLNLDMEATKIDLEKRVRDYLNLKLDNIEMQINHLKENIARLDRKVNKGYQQDTDQA